MAVDHKSKIKSCLIWLALGYVAGVAASFGLEKDVELLEHFKGTYALIGLGVGVLIAFWILLAGKNYHKDVKSFEGKTESGDKMNQHYNARFITENELLTNQKFMPVMFKDLPKLKKTGTLISSLYKNGNFRVNMYLLSEQQALVKQHLLLTQQLEFMHTVQKSLVW